MHICRYYFRIKEGNDNNDFRLNNVTGILFIRNPLSISRQQYYNLLIVAENINASCHRGKLNIKVNVVPNQLEFVGVTPVSILENASGNVTRVTAAGSTGSIQYSIIRDNVGTAFSINEDTGDIAIANSLDFETTQQYRLVIQATSSLGATATATQVINIIDVNEPPTFTNSCASANNCQFSVFENLTISSLIGYIVAVDQDLSSLPNGQLTYSLTSNDVSFAIDNTGRISLTALLDREVEDTHDITIRVMDGGSPSLSVMTTVTIRVLDSNDNAPVFIQGNTSLSVLENTQSGRSIQLYMAEDRDIGINAVITYSLQSNVSNLPFSISANGGVLVVSGPLDADRGITLYRVIITASNFDGLSTSLNVSIRIIDVNDNTPQFSRSPYMANVTEHAAEGTIVIRIIATDIDSGNNGEIIYSITDGNANNAFTIDNSTGIITVNADIDREIVNMFTLTVRAQDRGQPTARGNTTIVRVVVNDINDNAPIFTPNVVNLTIPEDRPSGSLGTTLNAMDNDEPGSPNSDIVYSIVSGNDGNHFSIGSSTGLLSLVSPLDFEEQDSYTLSILGQDRGNPVMTGTAVVNVRVTNINDHPPVITGNVEITVPEDQAVNSNLAQFNATDLDQMAVHFSLEDSSNLFAINRNTGVVTLIASLDFETARQHILIIKANDTVHIDNATLTVNVLDINEFHPQFIGETEFNVNEEQPTGTIVGTVQATDRDGSDSVRYFFETNTVSGLFSINSTTGIITTAAVLNREALVAENHFLPPESEEVIIVVAMDSGRRPGPLRTVQNITIRLNDINDNSPIFDPSSYEQSIPENTAGVTALFTASATDADLGSNAIIRYSLSVSNNFSVGSISGVVSATRPFDREESNIFNFMITARDQGTPSRSSAASVTVRVTDVNDNAPQFNQDADYVLNVAEDTSVRRVLTQVRVSDPDQGINAVIMITSQEGSNNCPQSPSTSSPCFFTVNNNGIVQLARLLDFETQSQHNVTLIATDSGSTRLSSTQILTINVVNVDERIPEFLGSCDSSVLEDVPRGTLVTVCPARDFDEVVGQFTNRISYSIIQGNEGGIFSIDADGNITTNVLLDRESTPSYTLAVQATDAGNLRATVMVSTYCHFLLLIFSRLS